MIPMACLPLLAGVLVLAAHSAEPYPARIVSVGGCLTETFYALGAEVRLVGVDSSSIYPDAATKLPQVGYARQLSAEGILSTKPDLVLVTTDAGPPHVLDQIEQAGIRIVRLPHDPTPEAAASRIRSIAEIVAAPERGEEIVKRLQAQIALAREEAKGRSSLPRVLFIYARGGGTINVAGRKTAADAIIGLAGAKNAVIEYDGYKPLTAESAVAAAPDVILTTTRGLESAGGISGLLAQPGLALTPAGRNRRVVALDDLLLLGFGPRLGDAVNQLARVLTDSFSSGS